MKFNFAINFSEQSSEIYSTKVTGTIKICIQGGIVAAKGISGIFMVNSIMAVSTTGKIKRDGAGTNTSVCEENCQKSNPLFSQLLQKEVEEQRAASMNCHTATYGQDSMIHAFHYQKREYHY